MESKAIIETLEGRLLCTAAHRRAVFSVDDRGTLYISGSRGNDVILVGDQRGDVVVSLNERVSTIRRTVRKVVIYGGAGNDLINCGTGGEDGAPTIGETTCPVYADGGAGRDTLYAGGGRFDPVGTANTLLGGGGNDRLVTTQYGLGPRVYMDGGPGNDALSFGQVMHGGSGDDVVTTDTEYGGAIFTSGLEKYIDLFGYATGQTVVAPKDYLSDLTSRDGKLVFSYLTDGVYQQSVVGPYLRGDGTIGVTVAADEPKEGVPAGPKKRWFITLNDRYTLRARQSGLTLEFAGSAVHDSERIWVVLLGTKGVQ